MLYKEVLANGTRVRVTFELPSSFWATTIALIGDFNGWDPHRHLLHQRLDGTWTITLELPAGRVYRFSYLVDGKDYCCEWHADQQHRNDSGTTTSIVIT